MSADMEWSHDFCLACDRQTDGSVYCGEACRLAEYDRANSSSVASSPASQQSPSWSSPNFSNRFFLPPAYDFAAYKTRSSSNPSRPQTSPATTAQPLLTPSSSHSSLFSMQSTSSTSSEATVQLSEDTRRALRGYASAFDQSRYQRRQSTN